MTSFWVRAGFQFLPVYGLAVLAGGIGLGSVGGIVCLVLALNGLGLVLWLQKRSDEQDLGNQGQLHKAAVSYRSMALGVQDPQALCTLLGNAFTEIVDATSVALITPNHLTGQFWNIPPNLYEPTAELLVSTHEALLALPNPLVASTDLGPQAASVRRLMEMHGASFVLVLRSSGCLLGVVLVRRRSNRMRHDYRNILRFIGSGAAAGLVRMTDEGARALRDDDLAIVRSALKPDERPKSLEGVMLRGRQFIGEVGGSDFWTYRTYGGGRLIVVIGHVDGPGTHWELSAAVKARADGALADPATPEPTELLKDMLRPVAAAGDNYHLKAIVGIVDPREGRFRFANLDHAQPYLLSKVYSAQPLQSHAAGTEDIETADVEVGPGSQIVMFSDGVSNAGLPYDSAYGDGQLLSVLQATARRGAPVSDIIWDDVVELCDGSSSVSDFTLVTIKLPAAK